MELLEQHQLISVLKCPRSLTVGQPQRLAQLPCCWQVKIPLPHPPNCDLHIGHVDVEEYTSRGGKTSWQARERVQILSATGATLLQEALTFPCLSPCLVHQLYLVLLTEGLYLEVLCTPEKELSLTVFKLQL